MNDDLAVAAWYMTHLADCGVTLRADGDGIRYKAPPGVFTDGDKQNLRNLKPSVLALLRADEGFFLRLSIESLMDVVEGYGGMFTPHPDRANRGVDIETGTAPWPLFRAVWDRAGEIHRVFFEASAVDTSNVAIVEQPDPLDFKPHEEPEYRPGPLDHNDPAQIRSALHAAVDHAPPTLADDLAKDGTFIEVQFRLVEEKQAS